MHQYLSKENINHFIKEALIEDVGHGDHSSLACVPGDVRNRAQLLVKDEGILAGVEMAQHIIQIVDAELQLELFLQDGTKIKKGDVAFILEGNAQSILKAERLILNCMQRMSGIATYTRFLKDKISHTSARLLDTRKTTPNFRLAEKWAVKIGGGTNHRYGLFDMIMLKDNHIDYAGGIESALKKTFAYLEKTGLSLGIEIETRNIEEVKQVLSVGGIQRIMLDNMSIQDMKTAVGIIAGKYETEASGGITEATISKVAETGVDFISVGALTHQVKSLDLSLKAIK